MIKHASDNISCNKRQGLWLFLKDILEAGLKKQWKRDHACQASILSAICQRSPDTPSPTFRLE